jgi:hypothetical protein
VLIWIYVLQLYLSTTVGLGRVAAETVAAPSSEAVPAP